MRKRPAPHSSDRASAQHDLDFIPDLEYQRYELEMLIGELCRSFNHDETGADEDAVLELCDRLEYAERTGDGELEIVW